VGHKGNTEIVTMTEPADADEKKFCDSYNKGKSGNARLPMRQITFEWADDGSLVMRRDGCHYLYLARMNGRNELAGKAAAEFTRGEPGDAKGMQWTTISGASSPRAGLSKEDVDALRVGVTGAQEYRLDILTPNDSAGAGCQMNSIDVEMESHKLGGPIIGYGHQRLDLESCKDIQLKKNRFELRGQPGPVQNKYGIPDPDEVDLSLLTSKEAKLCDNYGKQFYRAAMMRQTAAQMAEQAKKLKTTVTPPSTLVTPE
jgi:hypothetical protein